MRVNKKNIVIFLLSIIMLFTGMCSEIERTDSSFSYSKSASEAESIECVKNDTLYIGNCTNKLISGLRDTFQKVRRGQGRINLRSYAEFIRIKEILQMLVMFCSVALVVCPNIQSGSIAILNYIHNQDGEK